MKLLTQDQYDQLVKNHNAQMESGELDFTPVVKFFGGGACTWLITELDPESNLMFGLCDLGLGFPELGYVSLDELSGVRIPPFGLGVERDLHFKATKTLSQYADEATDHGRIAA